MAQQRLPIKISTTTAFWTILSLGMTHIIKPLILILLHVSLRTIAFAFPKSIEYKHASSKDQINNMTVINDFLEKSFARKETLSSDEWLSKLPNMDEKNEMIELITNLWKYEEFDGNTPNILDDYPNLKKNLNITLYNNIIIVHEKPALPKNLRRYWGYIAINGKRSNKRNIHHSAPHFESDGDVCREAAFLFESTSSRSLVIPGASRFAVRGDVPSTCVPNNQIADSAYNTNNMFHICNVVIADLTKNTDAIFLQWHGMAETSCKNEVFISSGTRDNSTYTQNNPAVKLRNSFNELTKNMKSSTPDNDPCTLIASSNIFGRYLNGVPADAVCVRAAQIENIQGVFVHIEQKRQARDAFKLWSDVIRHAYPARVRVSI